MDRQSELDAALAEVLQMVQEHQVDALLIAGDLFENRDPSEAAESTLYGFFRDVWRAKVKCIVCTGNHENPKRFGTFRPFLGACGIQIVEDVYPPGRPGTSNLVEVTDPEGAVAQIAIVPWLEPRRLAAFADDGGKAEYATVMPQVLEMVCSGFQPGKYHVLMAHLFVSGSLPGASERALSVTDTYAVPGPALPRCDYIALGHLHRPQVPANVYSPSRYSGSLLQSDFGEAGQAKGAVLVELTPKGTKLTDLPFHSIRQLRNVSGNLEQLAELDYEPEAWLKVTVQGEPQSPSLADRVREMLPNALMVKVEPPEIEEERPRLSLKENSPRDLFTRYLEDKHGDADPALVGLFDSLLEEVSV
jgi:exonuclease SbcD